MVHLSKENRRQLPVVIIVQCMGGGVLGMDLFLVGVGEQGDDQQGCQLSRIERESHAWTFLTLSRQAYKISRMNAKHPVKHLKSLASRKTYLFSFFFFLFFFFFFFSFFFFFFFFACQFFLKLKPIHNLTDVEAKRTAKY